MPQGDATDGTGDESALTATIERWLRSMVYLLLVVGIVLTVGGVYALGTQALAITTTETTEGVVVSSTVESGDQDPTGRTVNVVYWPNITYRYTVDGTQYTTSAVFPGGSIKTGEQRRAFKTDGRPKELVERYPPNTTVTVHYDPGNPADAYLVERIRLLPNLVMIGVGVLIAAPILWVAGPEFLLWPLSRFRD